MLTLLVLPIAPFYIACSSNFSKYCKNTCAIYGIKEKNHEFLTFKDTSNCSLFLSMCFFLLPHSERATVYYPCTIKPWVFQRSLVAKIVKRSLVILAEE